MLISSFRCLTLACCLLLSLPLILHATEYHVATNGINTNPGSEASPFLTIQKAASLMVPGDVCIIHEGIYPETVTPANNGVTFRAGDGETVIVSAYEQVTNWSLHTGSVYVAQLSWDLGDQNQLLYNGEIMNLARWPNKTDFNPFNIEAKWATGTSNSISQYQIPDWAWADGGVVWFLGKNRWTSWRRPITASAAGTVEFDTLPGTWEYNGSHSPVNGGEFFLMNILEALDSD